MDAGRFEHYKVFLLDFHEQQGDYEDESKALRAVNLLISETISAKIMKQIVHVEVDPWSKLVALK